MRALISAFALFVLWTIVPVVFAGQAAAPMFSDWLHAQKAGPSTRAKTQDASKAAHTKHLCLQETNQYNCRYFGCNQIDHYAGEPCSDVGVGHSPSCGDCTHGRFYQSDLTCCTDENHDSYGEEDSVGGFGSGVGSPTLKVGTCDWNIKLYQDYDLVDITRRRKQIWPPSTGGIRKIGSAFATCYLTPAADTCSDLLCDKMVLSFQGGAYEAAVKSTLPQDLYTAFPGQSCLDPFAFTPGFPMDIANLSVPIRKAATTTTDGTAVIFSGMVTLLSMDRQLEYDTGYMDYVASFTPRGADQDADSKRRQDQADSQVPDGQDSQVPGGQDSVGTIPTTDLPLVTPNTYKIKLVSSRGSNSALM